MAPAINESADRRRPSTLEEYLQNSLRLTHHQTSSLTNNTEAINQSSTLIFVRSREPTRISNIYNEGQTAMGLVADEVRREGDSPALPPSNSPLHDLSPHPYAEDTRKHAELVEISMKTVALLRRNQLLQKRLTALQQETREYVKSRGFKEGTAADPRSPAAHPRGLMFTVE